MEAIREQLEKPLIVGVVGFLVGVFFGLVILGWGLWPVKYVDAAARNLREDARIDYLRMAIDSYSLNHDANLAKARWAELQPEGERILAILEASDPRNASAIASFRSAIQMPAEVASPGTTPGTPTQKSGGMSPVLLLMISCLVILLVGAAVVGMFTLRKRQRGGMATASGRYAGQAAATYPGPSYEEYPAYQPVESQQPPIVESSIPVIDFMTTYTLGDDLFDDSFSIDAPSGEFLGECGVGISDTIGVGDPKKVTALEVWLFDKNDIQTITKVLMSRFAFSDNETRQKLMAKGEPVLVEPGKQIVLETATLRLTARVVDMVYGQATALPSESFFERITLQLSVARKNI